MRRQIRLRYLSFAVLAFSSAAGADEYRGSLADQLACTPDVLRLCGSDIPDTERIVQCLRRNLPQLSVACHDVFDAHASMPPADRPQVVAPPVRGPKGRAAPATPARPLQAAPPSTDDDD
ncbi:MAG: hypothetical protein AB1586_33230 [Pseudomonadota bacterium]